MSHHLGEEPEDQLYPFLRTAKPITQQINIKTKSQYVQKYSSNLNRKKTLVENDQFLNKKT